MSLTEKPSAQGQGHIEKEPSSAGEYMAESSSEGGRAQVEHEHEHAGSPDPESDEELEYNELEGDDDTDSMASQYEPLTGSSNQNQTFSESFQRYTSLPALNAPSSSSHQKIYTPIPATHTLPDGTAINTLPSLRSLPIHPSHHAHQSWRTHSAIRPPSPHHRSHHPQTYELPPPLRSPSPERPRRNSVMRLENILNRTSVDIASQIPRPRSAGDTRHASYPWSSELLKDPLQRETTREQGPRESSTRRSDFRVISGWGQSRDPGRGMVEDDDDAESASVTSTEGLSTMDVDVDTPPPMSVSISTPGPSSAPKSPTASFHESSGVASSSKSTLKPKRKVKMHPCPECHKEFPRPSGLKTHMTIHTKEKPFACAYPGCTRAFSVISNAKRHMRSHGMGSVDPSNPNSTLTFDANSPFALKKNKERAFVVDFDEPVIVDSSPPSTAPGTLAKGGLTLKWPAKGLEMVEGDASADSNGHGTGAMVGSHRGSGKRISSATHSRTGSYGGIGARANRGDGGSGTR